MTIKELEILAVPDQRAPCRLGMPPAGGVLMARNAMELPPAGVLDFVPSELTPQDDDDDLDELYAKVSENGSELSGNLILRASITMLLMNSISSLALLEPPL